MPRQPRYFIPGLPQHVIQRGVDRQAVFFEDADYQLYLKCLGTAIESNGCDIHAYVLMTNHTHLLVTPRTEQGIPLMVQALGRTYVQAINRKYRRTGTLWQGRYKASLVQSDRYLLTCCKYIEMNPIRAGMVELPGQYRWSSYACNALGKSDFLVAPHIVYTDLGIDRAARLRAYRRMFADELDHEMLATIRDTTNACRVLGGERFKDQIESMLGRSVRPRKIGRPPKI